MKDDKSNHTTENCLTDLRHKTQQEIDECSWKEDGLCTFYNPVRPCTTRFISHTTRREYVPVPFKRF